MPALADLARPPAHRGPLIAAGAVVLALGVALTEIRLDDELARGWHVLIVGATAALFLWLAQATRGEGGRPRSHESVLLVTGLLALYVALLRVADLVSHFGDDFPAGSFVWTSVLLGAVASVAAAQHRSAVCALIAALAFGVAVLSSANWIFDATSETTYRWLLLLLAATYAFVSLGLRGGSPRASEQLVNAAGFAILVLGASGLLLGGFLFGIGQTEPLPDGWELVVLVAGCGLLAYAAADRAPGPAYLGVFNLVVFVGATAFGQDTLEWWPAVLLVLGAGVLLVGLRPRRPLPPEPAPYTAGDLPLAARAADDDVVVRVERE
jgi:hypothetical protein